MGVENVKKVIVLAVLSALAIVGCSKEQSPSGTNSLSAVKKAQSSIPNMQVVESDVSKDRKAIKGQAWALLNARDYDGLDALAAKYRASKEHYPDGLWKLDYVYAGLQLSGAEVAPAWESRKKEIQDWIKAKPESVTSQVAMAQFLTDYAWLARGNGWASAVKDSDAETFAKRLQQAVEVLVAAKQQKEKCPVLWLVFQKAALGLSVERAQYEKIFEEGKEAFPDYVYFYRSRAVYLMPRWYGAEGELEKDLQKQADRLKGEAGDKLYARVVWSIHNYGSSENIFTENNFSWERTERGLDAILKEFPDSIPISNEAAHLAALGGSPEATQKYFRLTKGQVDLDGWQGVEQFESCWQWAFAK